MNDDGTSSAGRAGEEVVARRGRVGAGAFLWVGAAGLAIAAQYLLTPLHRREDGFALYLVAALVGAAAVILVRGDRAALRREDRAAAAPPRRRVPRWLAWAAGVAAITLTLGWFAAQQCEWDRTALWLWLSSLVAVAVAFAAAPPGAGARRLPADRVEIALAVAIVVVALALRLPALESFPVEVHGDEAWCGLEARSILNGDVHSLFGVGWYNLPYLGFALYVPFLWLFGDGLYGLRMASVFHGTASVLLLYLLGRELFRPRVGLLAAFLLAISQWHIHFSRSGIDYVQAGSVSLLLFWLLLVALRRRQPVYFLLAGYAAALCFDVYYAARLTPLLAAVYVLHRLAVERGFWKAHAVSLVMVVLGAALFALPMIFFFVQFPQTLMARTEGVWIFTPENRQHAIFAHEVHTFAEAMRSQVLHSIGAFNYFGETSLQHGRRAPLLDFWTGSFFVLGLGAFGWRLRRSSYFLVATWFWTTLLLGSVFTVDSLFSPRLSGALPILFFFPALYLDSGGEAFGAVGGRRGHVVALLAFAVFAVLATRDNVHEYFVVHPREQPASFYPTLARHVAAVNDDYQVYLFGDADDSLQFSTVQLLLPHLDGADVGPAMLPLPLERIPARKGVEFLVAAESRRAEERLQLMREAYPNGTRTAVTNNVGYAHLYAFRVEHADLLAANPNAELRTEPISGVAAAVVPLMPRNPSPRAHDPWAATVAELSSAEWEVVTSARAGELPAFGLPSLREPVDIAASPNGDIFVLDRGTRRVHCFSAAGQYRFTVRARAAATGWEDPRAVAVAGDGSLLVLDAHTARVYRFSPAGRFESVRAIADGYSPSGLARGSDGAILIADTGAERVVRWPDLEGDTVETTPGPPVQASPLAQPAAVAPGADGEVLVADAERRELVVLGRDLRPLRRWSLPAFDPVHAAHMLVIGDTVLVSDPDGGRIAEYDRDGTLLRSFGDDVLEQPIGMALLADGDVLVADAGASALQRIAIDRR